jgi:hypothetical protein
MCCSALDGFCVCGSSLARCAAEQVLPDAPSRRIRPARTTRSPAGDDFAFGYRHLWTPSISLPSGCGFAPRTVRRTTRFFVARASPDHVRLPRAFALGHSPHLSAGGARLATGSDVPCHLTGATWSFHTPDRPRRLPEGRRRDDRPDQNRSPDVRLRTPSSQSRTPSTSSIRTSQYEVGLRSSTHRQFSRAPRTPFRLVQQPARHGDGPPREVTWLRAVCAEALPTRHQEDASPRSLQPTCCHQAPHSSTSSRAPGSHPTVRCFRLAPPPARLYGLWNGDFHAGAD